MKDMMYLDESIQINFSMSKILKDVIEEAEQYYKEDNWLMYDMRVRDIEAVSKQDALEGFIDSAQMRLIWKRYGI